jgi:hypothetical protein
MASKYNDMQLETREIYIRSRIELGTTLPKRESDSLTFINPLYVYLSNAENSEPDKEGSLFHHIPILYSLQGMAL